MNYALIKSGFVQNVIVADAAFAASIAGKWDHVVPTDTAGIGWAYNGTTFTVPADISGEPSPASRILTHLQFRRLFTQVEREFADELEATFESSTVLTVEQKRTLRSGYKDFNAASEVNLDDPGIPPMLGLYVALGILTSNRPSEILA